LYTRLLDQDQATPLPGTENAFYPFFSPDGAWIGFFAVGKLKKIAVRGGGAVTLCDATLGAGASWGDDGYIAAALSNTSGISRVPEEGGTPVPLTKLSPGETTHRWPQVLPGGRAVLFNSANTTQDFRSSPLEAVSTKTGERKVVLRGGISAKYVVAPSGDGYLVYLNDTTLFAVRFDPNTLAVAGTARPVVNDVSSRARAGGDFALAPSGTLAYITGKHQQEGWPIFWLDQTGKTELLQAQLGVYSTPRFSPDGRRLAYLKNNGNGEDIWIMEIGSDSQPSRLTFFDGNNNTPIWTPDGKGIVFHSTNQAAPGLYWVPSDGSGQPQRLTDGKLRETARSFSPDGKRLSFEQLGNRGSFDIFTAAVEGEPGHPKLGKPELFLGSPANEAYAVFSPDGRWLAYTSVESGTDEVYVRPFPGPGGLWQISTGGGRFPLWSRNELLYQTLEGMVMAAPYSAMGGSFIASKPRVWAETHLKLNGNNSTYDVVPDGKRLAAILADDLAAGDKLPSQITFLVNFLDQLQQGVPATK
jgi:serine/threonine-protein kinase